MGRVVQGSKLTGLRSCYVQLRAGVTPRVGPVSAAGASCCVCCKQCCCAHQVQLQQDQHYDNRSSKQGSQDSLPSPLTLSMCGKRNSSPECMPVPRPIELSTPRPIHHTA